MTTAADKSTGDPGQGPIIASEPMRIYVSSESYPEIRNIRAGWPRHVIWWRAFRSGLRDPQFWVFAGVQVALVIGWVLLARVTSTLVGAVDPMETTGIALAAVGFAAVTVGGMAVTWGGDLMRPHLRRVSSIARQSCPSCGHLLRTQIRQGNATVRCPECGSEMPLALFDPPHAIPHEFRALRWRSG